jgi:hypothetical protein
MSEVIVGAAASVVTALIAAYLGHRRRVLAELEGQYDADLRALRLVAYRELWKLLEPLALYAREPPGYPTRSALETLAAGLRDWYFKTGGIYLSAEAREAYFRFQRSLWRVATSPRWDGGDGQVERPDFDRLYKLSSWLRTVLTYDVGTRRRFSLASHLRAEDQAAERDSERFAAELEAEWPSAP